mmetsp:Transcript_23824/g.77650  ORF Transcript_23824/g.77650 Transcript_23824/m.77650 type:complete len:84 (+) Transcript_23824:812-1063(+)
MAAHSRQRRHLLRLPLVSSPARDDLDCHLAPVKARNCMVDGPVAADPKRSAGEDVGAHATRPRPPPLLHARGLAHLANAGGLS